MTTVFDPVAPTAQGKPETPWQRFASNFRESRVAVIAFYALIVILAAALLAPLISPQDPYDLTRLDLLDAREPPGTKAVSGDMTYWLGSDSQGRDMLSAIVSRAAYQPRRGRDQRPDRRVHRHVHRTGRRLRGRAGGHDHHAHRRSAAQLPVDPGGAHAAGHPRPGGRQDPSSRW